MKKLYFLIPVFAVAVAMGCGGGSKGGAKEVADKFMKAFVVDMDIDGARKLVSDELKDEFPETAGMNELEKHFVQILKDHTDAHGYSFAYNDAESEIGSDAADLYYVVTAKGNPDFTGEANVELEKGEDGKWYVVDYSVDRDEDAIDFGF